MPGFDGTGPGGMGPMTGGGRGFCNPSGIGAINYGFRRGYGFRGITGYPASRSQFRPGIPYGYTYPEAGSFAPQMTQEKEIDMLREQSQAIRDQLAQIEARIKKLEPSS